MSMPWLRLYSEFASDPKIQLLAFEDQRHFVVILCLKCNGTLDTKAPTEAQFERLICKALGLDPASGAEAKRRLIEAGLIDKSWHPYAWDKRQYASDSSTARTRKYREKLNETSRERHGNVTVTDKNRYRTDTDTDTESEKDIDAASVDAPKKKRIQKPRSQMGGFVLNAELREYAISKLNGVDVDEMFSQFRNHHLGKGTVAADWPATWRTWCSKALTWGYPRANLSSSTNPKTGFNEQRDLIIGGHPKRLRAYEEAKKGGRFFTSQEDFDDYCAEVLREMRA